MKIGTDRSLPPEHGQRTERYYCRWCSWYLDTEPQRISGGIKDWYRGDDVWRAEWVGDAPEAIHAAIEIHLDDAHPEVLEAFEKHRPLPPTTVPLPPRWVAS